MNENKNREDVPLNAYSNEISPNFMACKYFEMHSFRRVSGNSREPLRKHSQNFTPGN